MKIVIVGAGIIGVTSAYYLARQGHTVTVLDRQPGVALETSFANAGEISPGYSAPWSAPGMPLKALRWMFTRHAPLILRPRLDIAMLRWMARFLTNCNQDRYRRNKRTMIDLAEYSRAELEGIRTTLGIRYDERTQGTLQLFRTERQMAGMALDRSVLDEMHLLYDVLDGEGCVAAEPGLWPVRDQIVGGLRLPGDETGDCFKFSTELAAHAAAEGVSFRFGTHVLGFVRSGSAIAGVETSDGVIEGDAFVVAAASHVPALMAPIGLRVPIYPIKGYSLTATIVDPARAPISTVMDETYKVAITRLGDRVRIGGMAELGGYDLTLPPARRRTLEKSVRSLFDGACDLSNAQFWSGLRPMTPDGPPLIGRTHLKNLFLNCGHGTLGWTMSCGSAAMLADIVAERASGLNEGAFSPMRYI